MKERTINTITRDFFWFRSRSGILVVDVPKTICPTYHIRVFTPDDGPRRFSYGETRRRHSSVFYTSAFNNNDITKVLWYRFTSVFASSLTFLCMMNSHQMMLTSDNSSHISDTIPEDIILGLMPVVSPVLSSDIKSLIQKGTSIITYGRCCWHLTHKCHSMSEITAVVVGRTNIVFEKQQHNCSSDVSLLGKPCTDMNKKAAVVVIIP